MDEYTKKYKARWILGKDVEIQEGISICGALFSNGCLEIKSPVAVATTDEMNKTYIAHVPMISAKPVYLRVEDAIALVEHIEQEIQKGALALSEPRLFDNDVLESLVAVYLSPGYEPDIHLKQRLQGIAKEHDAQIISFDVLVCGRFRSIDFGYGIKYRNKQI